MDFITKADYVYQRLRDDILSGKILSGTKLVTKDIAAAYNISAMPVRDAITRLKEMGLVKHIPHIGAHVCGVDIINYFSLKLLLLEAEALATFFATLNRTEETVSQLEDLTRQMVEAKDKGNLEAYGLANHNAHNTVYKACDDEVLIDYINNLFERTRMSVFTFSVMPENMNQSCDEHLRWLNAIKEQNTTRSVAIIRYQKSRSDLSLLNHIEQSLHMPKANDIFLQAINLEINSQKFAQYRLQFEKILLNARNDF